MRLGLGLGLGRGHKGASAPADSTAPVLSSPTDVANGATAATGSVSTDEGNGTLYWVVSTSATAPSAAQVKLGQMHTGAAAADSGSQAVSGTGVQTLSPAPSGLTASTAYTIHFMHEDAAANQSTVASGDGFTTAAGALALSGTARVGQTITVANSGGDATYITARRPSAGVNTPWMVIYPYDPTAGFVLPTSAMGLEVRAENWTRASGMIEASAAIGPVLHASDPTGTTVADQTEFDAAVAAAATTIILDGTVDWSAIILDASSITRTSGTILTITADQATERVLLGVNLNGSSYIKLEGLEVHKNAAASTGSVRCFPTTGATANIQFVGCRVRGDEVLAAVYQDDVTDYTTTGMNFMPHVISCHDAAAMSVDGMFLENTWSMGDWGSDAVLENRVARGLYYDANRYVSASGQGADDQLVVDGLICLGSYTKREEMDGTSEPHFDWHQFFNSGGSGSFRNTILRNQVLCIGDTRAKTATAPQTLTAMINNMELKRPEISSVAADVRGTIAMYFDDAEDAYVRRLSMACFGNTETPDIRPGNDDETLFVDSNVGATLGAVLSAATDQFTTEDNTTLTNTKTDLFENASTAHNTIQEFLLGATSKTAYATAGAVIDGYLVPAPARPAAPTISTEAATAGGYDITMTTVGGAVRYRIRHRPTTTTNAWVVTSQASAVFSLTGLGSEATFDFQMQVETGDGYSLWSTLDMFTTGAAGGTAPGATFEGFDTDTTTSQFRRHPVAGSAFTDATQYAMAVHYQRSGSGTLTKTDTTILGFSNSAGTGRVGDWCLDANLLYDQQNSGGVQRVCCTGIGIPNTGASTAFGPMLRFNETAAAESTACAWEMAVPVTFTDAGVSNFAGLGTRSVTLASIPVNSVALCFATGTTGTAMVWTGDTADNTADADGRRMEALAVDMGAGGGITVEVTNCLKLSVIVLTTV